MFDCLYEVVETGTSVDEKTVAVYRDRELAIKFASELNSYFSLYSDRCPIYNVKPLNGYAGKKFTPPKLSTLLFEFDEEGNLKPPILRYSEIQSQIIEMYTEPEAISFYGNEDTGSFYCEGKLRVDVSDAEPDKRWILMKRAHERFKYINSLIEIVFGHNLEYLVGESDWYDLDDNFAPVIKPVNEYLQRILITDLETHAAMVTDKSKSESVQSDSE